MLIIPNKVHQLCHGLYYHNIPIWSLKYGYYFPQQSNLSQFDSDQTQNCIFLGWRQYNIGTDYNENTNACFSRYFWNLCDVRVKSKTHLIQAYSMYECLNSELLWDTTGLLGQNVCTQDVCTQELRANLPTYT